MRDWDRVRAGTLVVGGLCIALWLVVHPWDALFGAGPPRTTAWGLAHHLHLLGGLLVLVGLPALATGGSRGGAALVAATAGMGLFVATGVVTADVMPRVAAASPDLLGPDGPFYSGPYFAVVAAQRVLAGGGLAWLAFEAARAGRVPRAAAWAALVGGVLVALPPRPIGFAPWAVMVAGGVVWGLAVAWLGATAARAPPRA